MSAWARVRAGIILLVLLAALTAAGKMLRSPKPLDRALPAVDFPAEPSLPGWRRIPDGETRHPTPATNHYRHELGAHIVALELQFIPDLPVHYVRNPMLQERFLHRGELPLDAGLRFTVNSRGVIIPNLRTANPRLAKLEIEKGGYGFWNDEEGLHLSTVVTASGDAAITRPRVARSMLIAPLSATLVGKWLCGRAVLPDRRCVLAHFSIEPAPAPGEGRRILATALADWRAAHPFVFPASVVAP